MKFLKTLGAIFSAIALVLLGMKAAKKKAQARRKENAVPDMLNSGVTAKVEAAKEMLESAQKDKEEAVEIKRRMNERLEKIGGANEELADVAHRFNAHRVRRDS